MSNHNEKNNNEEEDDAIIEVNWNRESKEILLPEGMDCRSGIEALRRKDEEMNQEVQIEEVFDAYPTDGAHALMQSLKAIYGWTNLKSKKGGFFSPDQPCRMIGVSTGPDSTVQVPWGQIGIPGVDGYLETTFKLVKRRPVFMLTGRVKRRHEKEIHKVAETTREYLRENSIYRGAAIKIEFPDLEYATSLEDFEPEFLDVSNVNPDELIFSDDVSDKINSNLFTPIRRSQFCRDAGIPLKRGVLLAGQYGVGKTMTAYVAAKYAAENNWTFIYLKDVNDLAVAIQFARMYAPAVIFAEDLDNAIGTSRRDNDVNEILNTIDGVDSKDSEIIVCLTTNHVDRINRAMLRPGRLDATIKVTAPDANAAIRLVKQYARGRIAEGEDLTEVGELLDGMIPAVIRETVERAKLTAISNLDDAATETDLQITASDLKVAASTMKDQLDLLEPQTPDMRSDVEKAAGALGEKVVEAFLSNATPVDGTNGKTVSKAVPKSAVAELAETSDQPS